MLEIAEYIPPKPQPLWRLARQAGVDLAAVEHERPGAGPEPGEEQPGGREGLGVGDHEIEVVRARGEAPREEREPVAPGERRPEQLGPGLVARARGVEGLFRLSPHRGGLSTAQR
mgnify:CR=1 FL=1